MMDSKKIINDEVDLIELIIIIFKHRWKIVVVTTIVAVLATIIAFVYEKDRIASTEVSLEIKTISSISEIEYKAFNKYIRNIPVATNYGLEGLEGLESLASFSIYKKSLLSLFVKEFSEFDIIENVIKKYDLMSKEDDFKKLVSSFEIIGIKTEDDKLYLNIYFQGTNTRHVKSFLTYIEKYINEKVRLNLLNNFNAITSTQKKLDKFKIEDLEIQANKLIEMNEIQTTKKLFFLEEQAEIARSLGIVKNIKMDFPQGDPSLYYMRGYEVIEKEIEIMKIRTNSPENVITKKLQELNYNKQTLEKSLVLQRIEKIFQETPIPDQDNFYAARIIDSAMPDVKASKIELINLLLIVVLTLICMIIYVLILNGIQNRR